MSRVDEAMRRAEQESSTREGTQDLPHHPGQDAAGLAAEPFPGEAAGSARASSAPLPPVLTWPSGDANHRDRAAESNGNASDSLFDHISNDVAERLVIDDRMPPGAREQYRRVAATLHDAQASQGVKVIMIASAVMGEGKTLTAANLALTLSASYRKRVLLVDADLRRPSIHQIFHIRASAGLAEGLDASSEAKLVVRQLSPTLSVLPAGRPSRDPMSRLISDRMRRLIAEARETFDWVIMDTPPLVLLPDAPLLASMVDGAVLVVRAASTPHGLIKRATEAVGRQKIVGIVLNRAPQPARSGYYGAYEDYYLRGEARQ